MSKSFIVTDDSMKPDACDECGAEKKWLVLKHGETADHDAWWECVICGHKFPVVRLFDISEEEPPTFDFEGDDEQERCSVCGRPLYYCDDDLCNDCLLGRALRSKDTAPPDDDEAADQLKLF